MKKSVKKEGEIVDNFGVLELNSKKSLRSLSDEDLAELAHLYAK